MLCQVKTDALLSENRCFVTANVPFVHEKGNRELRICNSALDKNGVIRWKY